MDEYKFEIKEDIFSARMPLISEKEYKQLNSDIEGFARAITKLVIVDKNMAIAQHIIRKQQEKIEQLEAEKKEAIKYCKSKSTFQTFGDEQLERSLEMYVNKTKNEILEILKGEKNGNSKSR